LGELQPAVDVLRLMYVTNARLCHMEGLIGTLQPEAHAGAIVSEVDRSSTCLHRPTRDPRPEPLRLGISSAQAQVSQSGPT